MYPGRQGGDGWLVWPGTVLPGVPNTTLMTRKVVTVTVVDAQSCEGEDTVVDAQSCDGWHGSGVTGVLLAEGVVGAASVIGRVDRCASSGPEVRVVGGDSRARLQAGSTVPEV